MNQVYEIKNPFPAFAGGVFFENMRRIYFFIFGGAPAALNW